MKGASRLKKILYQPSEFLCDNKSLRIIIIFSTSQKINTIACRQISLFKKGLARTNPNHVTATAERTRTTLRELEFTATVAYKQYNLMT